MLAISGMSENQLAEQRLLDISAIDLIETIFPKYGAVELKPKTRAPIDAFNDILIPALDRNWPDNKRSGDMATEYGGYFSLEAVELGKKVAQEVRQSIPPDEAVALRDISAWIKRVAETHAPKEWTLACFKNILYSQVLLALSMNNGCVVNFDKIREKVGYLDFLYLSAIVGTVNVASEFTPNRGIPRAAIALQLLTSFIMLGIIVGAMVNFIGAVL